MALLVVVVFALAWARRGAVKSEGSSLFPAFDGVPSWVGLALALIGLGSVAAGAYSYYVHDREFWTVVQFFVVGFGAMALSQVLPRFRRPFARD